MPFSASVRALLVGAVAACLAAAVAVSCSEPDPCASGPCAAGESCSAERGVAVCRRAEVPDAGAPDAGSHPGACIPACHADETCDFDTGRCVTCTATRGCDDPSAPVCDTSVEGGRCVGCAHDGDCPGSSCDTAEHHCRPPPDAGTPDAGTPDGGLTGNCEASLDCDPPCENGETCVAGRCKPHVSCTTECERGFHCFQGQCVLNGGGGPIQVTLRWADGEDLDLHVVEPGGCEIYYENTSCVGSLDLDSNAGCNVDDIDIENVIYDASATPPSGTYRVRVDYYQKCSAQQPVPYELIVRVNGVETGFCGSFQPSQADQGHAGSGRLVTTFSYP